MNGYPKRFIDNRDLKIVVSGKRLTSDNLFAIKTKSLTARVFIYIYRIYSQYRKPRGISLQKRRTRFRDFENLTGIFWDFQRFLGIFNPKKSFGNKYQRFHKISLLYFCFAFVCIAQSTVELWPPHCNRYVIFFSLLKSHFNRISKTLIKQ